ncbi:MAG: serine/threonine-protein kinase [Candidatus Thorarchaeota archaeon]
MSKTDYFKLDFWKEVRTREPYRRYRIVDFLGIGGTAASFLAVCISPKEYIGRLVAIQFFRKYSVPERLNKFLEAFSFLSDCTHPSIVNVYGLHTYYERPMIVTEYLPLTLHDVIRKKKSSIVEKTSFAMQLLSALVFLEQQKVVHRDIKPSNIFVKGKSCMLGDFGMMKRIETTSDDEDIIEAMAVADTYLDGTEVYQIPLTEYGMIDAKEVENSGITVTGHYWSPDKVLDYAGIEDITPASDVYQLGLVLAHLFTGWNHQPKLPRDGRGEPDLDMALQVALGPESVRRIPSYAGPGIANLISKMLEKNPSDRPQAKDLIVSWIGVFEEVTRAARVIEGRVF